MRIAAVLACLFLPGAQEAGDDEAKIRELIGRLRSDYLTDRQEARSALEKIGAPAEAVLVASLGDSDFRVRRACLGLLAKLRSAKAIPRIAELSREDREGTVRDAAFDYLCAMGKEAEEALIDALGSEDPGRRMRALKTLSSVKSRKCAAKVAELYEEEEVKEIKAAAFQCLQELGDVAQPHLVELLNSDDAEVRSGALEGLSGVKSAEVLAKIGEAFVKEAHAGVLESAFTYLSDAGEDALPHFLAGLKSTHQPVRKRSLAGLTKLKGEKAIVPVGELFRSDPSEAIITAAAGFLETRGSKAEEEFVKALESERALVRTSAIRALAKLRTEAPFERIARAFREDREQEVHRAAFSYLVAMEKRAEKELIVALDDADRKIRKEAVQALGRMRSEAALDRLVAFLSELDAEMRDEAVKALGAIGPKGLEAVRKAVEEGTLKRRAADLVLVRFYEEEVVRLFEKLISDRGGTGYYEGQFRELKDFGVEKAVPVLLKIARNEVTPEMFRNRPGAVYREQRREMAIMALGDLGDASVIEPLRQLLGEASGASVSTRAEIVLALHKLGDKKPLEEFLGKTHARAEECLKGDLKAEGCRHLFSEALLLGRVGRREEAEAVYRRLLKEAKHPGVDATAALAGEAHYNLACLSARSGKKEEAIGQLREAVRSGFTDRDWILRDKDLDPIRGEEGYKKLIADDELFGP